MKRVYFTLFLICYLYINCTGQSSTLGHLGTTADWLGWNTLTSANLEIGHQGNHRINFYTNAGSSFPGSLTNLRMFIEEQGHIGIGNFSTANTLLHLHQSNDFGVDFQMTDNSTGNSTTDGFEMEYHTAGYFNMTQNEFLPFDIRTQGTDGNEYRRIRIWAADTVGRNWTTQHTRVGILSGTAGGYRLLMLVHQLLPYPC